VTGGRSAQPSPWGRLGGVPNDEVAGSGTIPAVLCIDVEPDPRHVPVPAAEDWLGFRRVLELIGPLRDLLAASSGRPAQLGWFLRMDPQIEVAYGDVGWVARAYGGDLARLVQIGDELGLHPHSWRWVEGGWVSDQADAAWVAHCADVSLDAYADAFGEPCRAYRHGDRFTSESLLAHLVTRGIAVDLTPEPGLPESTGLAPEEPTTGTLPAVPVERSRARRIALPDAGAVTVVPLTTAPSLGQALDGSPFASETLALWTPPRLFAARLEARLQDPALDHLAFAIRSELPLHAAAWSFFERNLAHLSQRLGDRMEWVTPSTAAARVDPDWGGAGWPTQTEVSTMLASYGSDVETAIRLLEHELASLQLRSASERTRSDATIESLRRSIDDGDSRTHQLEQDVTALAATLDEVRDTLTWRLHDRLLPVLRVLARLRRGGRG
jgi:hypothetical protein